MTDSSPPPTTASTPSGDVGAGLDPYDAVLLLSFGGPRGPQDVVPFLENVTRGRGIPRERLVEVGEHYFARGGASPINGQNEALVAALRAELSRRGLGVPVLWGNRNWDPYLVDVLRAAAAGGARRVLVVTTSAYSSYSGCRQYREDLARALAQLASEGVELEVDQVRRYFNTPGFVEANTDAVVAAARSLGGPEAPAPRLVFVTHSVPTAMAASSGPAGDAYVDQHRDVAAEVAARAGDALGAPLVHDLVYCSRSGPATQPWTEPDVNDHLEILAVGGVGAVVLAPIGFVSDHMEVVHDLDTEAAETARRLGLRFARAATVGVADAFVRSLVDTALERAAAARTGTEVVGGRPAPAGGPQRQAVGRLAPAHDVCAVGCCPNARADLPAACGVDSTPPLVATAGAGRPVTAEVSR